MAVWLVRAGKNGEREDLALDEGLAVIGWDEVPDISNISSREELESLLRQVYADRKPNTVLNWVAQLWAFTNRIKPGDLVALPLKKRSAIAIGRVEGPYQYRPDLPDDSHHTRRVEWLRKDIPRSSFEQDLLYSLGAAQTIAQIRRNNAEERIRAMVEGRQPLRPEPSPDEAEESTEAAINLQEYAQDQISEYLGHRFKGHALARLVAAVLESQGYRTEVSPEGADGGVDIIAGRGPMGFDPPRLCVQVKSGDQPADVKVLRELQGVMKGFGADQGLFVSWGGFRSSVYAESRRLFFEIRLWDAGDVVEELLRYYEQLPDDLKAELPLKRIWTLVPEEE